MLRFERSDHALSCAALEQRAPVQGSLRATPSGSARVGVIRETVAWGGGEVMSEENRFGEGISKEGASRMYVFNRLRGQTLGMSATAAPTRRQGSRRCIYWRDARSGLCPLCGYRMTSSTPASITSHKSPCAPRHRRSGTCRSRRFLPFV